MKRPAHQRGKSDGGKARGTVRFVLTQAQREEEFSLDVRINAAKATAANYCEMAERAGRPVRRCMLENLARLWEKRAEELIAQRLATLQPDLVGV